MAEIVRRRSWGGVLPLGRHVSISGSRSIHAPSVSIAPSSFQEEQNARHHKQFKLEQALVFDDPEPDDFVYLLTNSVFEAIVGCQERFKNWRNLSRRERLDAYASVKGDLPSKLTGGFEEFNELMRLDLRTLAAR